MIIRESSTYRHGMEVTIDRAEAIAIEETPDKFTIILRDDGQSYACQTSRISPAPHNCKPVKEKRS